MGQRVNALSGLLVHWDDGECTEMPASALSSALTQERESTIEG